MNRALLRPSYDDLIIHAVERANKYKCEKMGRVWRSVLGCELLFRRMRPDVMCHLLVSGPSQHIWPLFYIRGSAAAAWQSASLCRRKMQIICQSSAASIRLSPGAGCLRKNIKKKGVFTWVVLGFIRRVAELNVEVDVEDGVAVLVPRDWERQGGLEERCGFR